MEVTKNGVTFRVDVTDVAPGLAAWWREGYSRWEQSTFRVLDAFLSAQAGYLDVGAWIGPTVLYAAAKADRVYCLEPDPVAHAALLRNLRVNPQYRNVETLERCLSNREEIIEFGGNGALGNSESTMLADQAGYAQRCGDQPRKASADKEWRWRATRTVPVRTVTVEGLCARWKLEDCALVKIDIEGGEKIVIPAMASFLRRNRPTLCLSLHWVYLERVEIQRVLHVLSQIYAEIVLPDLSTVVTVSDILDQRISDIVCVGAAR